LRKAIIDKLNNDNLNRASFIHKSSYVSDTAIVNLGTFVAPFCTIAHLAVVDKDCILGPYSMVSHNSTVGSGSLMHSGAMIAGSTMVGQYCQLNLRSSIIDNLSICDEVCVGANSMITKNIEIPGYYVGAPARKIKENI
jgi:acetyltransferase-like isoleucine patch superfamily enzyme